MISIFLSFISYMHWKDKTTIIIKDAALLNEQINKKNEDYKFIRDAKRTMGVILPNSVYVLANENLSIDYKNILKNFEINDVEISSNNGDISDTKFSYTPSSNESFELNVIPKDLLLKDVLKKTVNFETVVETSSTSQVNILAIGDSLTRSGEYLDTLQNRLPNVKSVGTRTFNNGETNTEGRGGWTLSRYFNQFGMTDTVDSPFLFPNGVEGMNYWGNTEMWKKVCYTESDSSDYNGFQKIAYGWSGSTCLYDENGYPLSPNLDDVVLDPIKNQKFLIYDGNNWQPLNPQPSMEFNFTKYIQRNSEAFGENTPTMVSTLLGTNDILSSKDINGDLNNYFMYLEAMINSIHDYNPDIKIIINLPTLGNTQKEWDKFTKNNNQIVESQYDANIQKLSLRLIERFDTDEQKSENNVYISPMNAVIDKNDLVDHVHSNLQGYEKMGLTLAGLVQKLR